MYLFSGSKEADEERASGSTSNSFRGQGMRLNASEEEETLSTTNNGMLGQFLASLLPPRQLPLDMASAESLPVAVRLVTFWQDGFSIGILSSATDSEPSQFIGEGEETDCVFYSYDDPKNEQLLQSLLSGHAPLAPLQVQFGQRVELKILDQKSKKYSERKVKKQTKKDKPFSGQGSRLGS